MTEPQPLPVVLVSGWGMPVAMLDGLVPQEVVSARLVPGEPGIEAGDAPRDWLERVMPSLPERALWIGWSLGGQLAMEAARHWPQRLAGVVTIASTPSFVALPDWPEGMPEAQFEAFSRQLEADAAATLAQFAKLMVQGDGHQRELRRALRACSPGAGLNGQALSRTLQWLGELDQRPLWRQCPVPAQHLFGERDPLVNAATPRALSLPASCWQLIPGMAHWPGGPWAEQVKPLIHEFRKQLR